MDNNQNKGNFEKWYENKVGFMISILVPFVVALAFIFQMKADIAVIRQSLTDIKDNDFAHTELEITQLQQEISDMQKNQIAQGEQITQALTLLRK